MRQLILTLVFALGLQAHGLESQCYPNTPEAKSWPVCVIYLHGWHPANESGGYTRYEKENQPILEQFSTDYLHKHKCRIASPAAPKEQGKRFLDWQRRPLSMVEDSARNACGGKSVILKKGRTLVGFSAGGWEGYRLGTGNCKDISEYNSIMAIGIPELKAEVVNHRVKGSCPQLRIYRTHDFPTQFSESMQRSIAASIVDEPGRVQTASLPETTVTN